MVCRMAISRFCDGWFSGCVDRKGDMGIFRKTFSGSADVGENATDQIIKFLKSSKAYKLSAYTFTELFALLFVEFDSGIFAAGAEDEYRKSIAQSLLRAYSKDLESKFKVKVKKFSQHTTVLETRIDNYSENIESEQEKSETIKQANTYLIQASNTKSYFGSGTVYLGNLSANLQGIMELPDYYNKTIFPLLRDVIAKK